MVYRGVIVMLFNAKWAWTELDRIVLAAVERHGFDRVSKFHYRNAAENPGSLLFGLRRDELGCLVSGSLGLFYPSLEVFLRWGNSVHINIPFHWIPVYRSQVEWQVKWRFCDRSTLAEQESSISSFLVDEVLPHYRTHSNLSFLGAELEPSKGRNNIPVDIHDQVCLRASIMCVEGRFAEARRIVLESLEPLRGSMPGARRRLEMVLAEIDRA